MGREIRRVPPNWEHPQEQVYNPRSGCYSPEFKPMFNRDSESAFEEWQTEYLAWLTGEFNKIRAKHPDLYKVEEPYRAFCAWHGNPPNPNYYRPKWDASTATWYQVYETVSEGTPVTPPFETKEELVEYLVANGDFWDQKRQRKGSFGMKCDPWDREAAKRFVDNEWAPSLVVVSSKERTTIKEPRDG